MNERLDSRPETEQLHIQYAIYRFEIGVSSSRELLVKSIYSSDSECMVQRPMAARIEGKDWIKAIDNARLYSQILDQRNLVRIVRDAEAVAIILRLQK